MIVPERKKTQSLLDMAPLIDCIFLLLVFFMVTSSFQRQHAIPVVLPDVDSREPIQSNIGSVLLHRDGSIFLEDCPVDLTVFPQRIAEYKIAHASTEALVIYADRDSTTGVLATLIASARSAGFSSISFGTQSQTRTDHE